MKIWRFPKSGVPLNHAFCLGFSLLNHPAMGVPPFMGTPIGILHMFHGAKKDIQDSRNVHGIV